MPRLPREIQDTSPSARLVYLLLDAEGALPKQHVQSMSGLSADTTRRALRELEDAGAVLDRPDPTDGRRRKYVLAKHLEVA
jgi:DNA-binding MarR family transcriptional regulator